MRRSSGSGHLIPIQYGSSTNSASPLEPIVGDTLAVAWQILECVQPIKVIDRYLSYRGGIGET